MNQQRSRRFRSAQEQNEKEQEEERLRAEFAAQGVIVPAAERTSIFDSNIITPGTGFMHRLSHALQYYIHTRINTDSAWRQVKVILSDANVPGEGEHKIMSFIRLQRGRPGWNPNTKHVLYGLDADLIMLGLATHEAHFAILRENVFDKGNNNANTTNNVNADDKDFNKLDVYAKPFQFVDISVVRECIDMELRGTDPDADVERLVDDFVFLCFFVGNDFLPHVPTLDIREGAINLLMQIYRTQRLRGFGGYLTDGASIDVARVEQFLKLVAASEEAIFRKRLRMSIRDRERSKRQKRDKRQDESRLKSTISALHTAGLVVKAPAAASAGMNATSNRGAAASIKRKLMGTGNDDEKRPKLADAASAAGNDEAAATTQTGRVEDADVMANSLQSSVFQARVSEALKDRNDLSTNDKYKDSVRLGEDGWKDRYYKVKFGASSEGERRAISRDVVSRYVEGLQWVMRYYYDGVASWEWYFPYHYAPFASDFVNLDSIDVTFDLGKPFRPFDQLMGVLPAASGHCLPDAYSALMRDPDSPIIDFYPTDFDIDLNGKKFAWQAVVLLPFIDPKRLLGATASLEKSLGEEERQRNCTLSTLVFAHDSHPMAAQMLEAGGSKEKLALDVTLSDAMSGYLCAPRGKSQPARLDPPPALPSATAIEENHVACSVYVEPNHTKHECRILPGARLPAATLEGRHDIHVPDRLWHQEGGGYGNGPHGSWRGGGGGHMSQNSNGGGAYNNHHNSSSQHWRRGGGGVSSPALAQAAHRLLDRSMALNVGAAPRGNLGVYRQVNAAGGGMYGSGGYAPQPMQHPQHRQAAAPVASYNPFSALVRNQPPPHPQQQQQQQVPFNGQAPYPGPASMPSTAPAPFVPYPQQAMQYMPQPVQYMQAPPQPYRPPDVGWRQLQQQQQRQQQQQQQQQRGNNNGQNFNRK